MSKTRIAIVYHSGYGHTKRQAEAVKSGVEQVEGAEALLLTVEEAQTRWEDLNSSEAIIFGAPTYMGSASGLQSLSGRDIPSSIGQGLCVEGQDRSRLHQLGRPFRR